MRIVPIAAGCIAVAVLACAPATQSRADELRYIETRDLRIVNLDPSVTYLVPYATQCFLNALAAQHARFGYTPDGKVTVLLQDFSDRGNATAVHRSAKQDLPRHRSDDAHLRDVQPGRTNVHARRITKCVHFVTGDQASPEDERYRRLFGGKVVPIAEHPESLLYYYLTAPRNTAPRWYHEGSAVFMETWEGGGYGRAQGGYDEMMFRAMVRDGARFYDPLGLVSKGTEVDFQVGANAYLYGTRFMSYLALEYGPEKLIDWWRRDAGSRRSYSDDFRRVYGKDAGRGLAGLGPLRARVPGEKPRRGARAPRDPPSRCHANRSGRAVARRWSATTGRRCTLPCATPAVCRTSLRYRSRTAR